MDLYYGVVAKINKIMHERTGDKVSECELLKIPFFRRKPLLMLVLKCGSELMGKRPGGGAGKSGSA